MFPLRQLPLNHPSRLVIQEVMAHLGMHSQASNRKTSSLTPRGARRTLPLLLLLLPVFKHLLLRPSLHKWSKIKHPLPTLSDAPLKVVTIISKALPPNQNSLLILCRHTNRWSSLLQTLSPSWKKKPAKHSILTRVGSRTRKSNTTSHYLSKRQQCKRQLAKQVHRRT